MKRLIIDLESLPEEGKNFSGKIDRDLFGIDCDEAKVVDDLHYDLHAQRFGNELFLQGKISAAFEFCCVRCLNRFVQTLVIDDFSTSIKIDDQWVIDPSDQLREEILLDFPAYPHCEDADEPSTCVIPNMHFGVDKSPSSGVNSSAPTGESGVWDALDALGGISKSDKKDQKSWQLPNVEPPK